MKKMLIILAVLFVFVGGSLWWGISTRNKLITLDEQVQSSWAQVENVYQRRLDLVPNLVNTVKGYAAHEKTTLEEIVKSRSQVGQLSGDALKSVLSDPAAFEKFQRSQSALSSALSRLMVVVERYPDLKANQNFIELQAQLEGSENRIAVERKRFNDVTMIYNSAVRRFPASLIAFFAGLKERPYFKAQQEAGQAPKVEF